MHIEPGLVTGAKLAVGYATAATAGGYTLQLAWAAAREKGIDSLMLRTLAAAVSVFTFFQILPHFPVGVSEVHFILGSTLFLILGAAPAALGLTLGLLVQGLFFAPFDLPQFGMNITTLLVPLFAVKALADRIIPAQRAYVDLDYAQALMLSIAYQGGVVAWVTFWAFLGQGFGAENVASVTLFGSAYMLVVLIEPLADLAVLAAAKAAHGRMPTSLFTPRLHDVA